MIRKNYKGINVLLILFIALSLLISASNLQAEETGILTVKGKVKGFANPAQSKTISLNVAEKGVMVFKYDDATKFKNFKSLLELKGGAAVVEYRVDGSDKIATSIKKAYVKLPEGVKEIKTAEVAALVEKGPAEGNYFLVDARPEKRYAEGHIPTAVSIPTSKLKKKGAALLPDDKDITLVFYCGGPTCGLSPKAAGMAKKWGYSNVSVYVQGEPEWTESGHLTAATAEYVKNTNIVLIDLRDSEEVNAGHIPGAVSIPAGDLSGAKERFPASRTAPIVFYSDDTDDLNAAVNMVSTWGYQKTSVFFGGTESWSEAGYELKQGPAATKIVYVRKPLPGEVSIAEFKTAVRAGSAVIVDVRTPQEHRFAHFKGAVNVPVDEISSRLSEIPKDKAVYIHCRTGVRAEMAYSILKEKGYNVKFLKAKTEFRPDGSYEFVEW